MDQHPDAIDPNARYAGGWNQPHNSEVLVDSENAVMTQETWNALPRYDHSEPTGVWVGKMWRSGEWFCWIGKSSIPNEVSLHSRRALLLTSS
jgi:hypothetical protein